MINRDDLAVLLYNVDAAWWNKTHGYNLIKMVETVEQLNSYKCPRRDIAYASADAVVAALTLSAPLAPTIARYEPPAPEGGLDAPGFPDKAGLDAMFDRLKRAGAKEPEPDLRQMLDEAESEATATGRFTPAPSTVPGDARSTVSGTPPVNPPSAPTPTSEKRPDGQFKDHWVLSPADRALNRVRPYRENYRHVGAPGPKYPLRDLTADERARYAGEGYVQFEEYPKDGRSALGRFWTQKELDHVGKGCGAVTRMPRKCAETYAVSPGYYGATFCCGCGAYFRVGRDGEFVWEGTDERVGV